MSDEPVPSPARLSPIEPTIVGAIPPSNSSWAATGCGCLLMFGGAYMVLIIYGFASMVDPALEGAERWAEIIAHIGSGGGWGMIVGGVLFILVGLGLVVLGWVGASGKRRPGSSKPKGFIDPMDV